VKVEEKAEAEDQSRKGPSRRLGDEKKQHRRSVSVLIMNDGRQYVTSNPSDQSS